MKRYRGLLLVGFAVVLFFSFAAKMSSQRNETSTEWIINRTNSFEVSDIKRNGNELQLILKNNYDKNITAFTISPGSYNITRDLSENGHALAPGASYAQSCTLPRSATVPVITILSVVFEDRTSDGEAEAARAILDRRLGHRTQLIRILQHFDRVRQSPDDDLPAALDAARSAIVLLPVKLEGNSSRYVEAGLHNAKEEALLELEELERVRQHYGTTGVRKRLTEISMNYRKRVATP